MNLKGKWLTEPVKILLWVYGVGVAGMLLPFSRDLFIRITPLNLLFAAAFLFFGRKPAPVVWLVGLGIFISSFLVEAIGVNTGRIFGEYSYGYALGPKLLNTPVIIGLNWFVLIYCTNIISRRLWRAVAADGSVQAAQAGGAGRSSSQVGNESRRFPAGRNQFLQSLFVIVTGSLLMVGYDLLLEQAAIRLDMWTWGGEGIPFSNYVAWFLFSLLFHTAMRLWGEDGDNERALPLFAVQNIFFAIIVGYYAVVL